MNHKFQSINSREQISLNHFKTETKKRRKINPDLDQKIKFLKNSEQSSTNSQSILNQEKEKMKTSSINARIARQSSITQKVKPQNTQEEILPEQFIWCREQKKGDLSGKNFPHEIFSASLKKRTPSLQYELASNAESWQNKRRQTGGGNVFQNPTAQKFSPIKEGKEIIPPNSQGSLPQSADTVKDLKFSHNIGPKIQNDFSMNLRHNKKQSITQSKQAEKRFGIEEKCKSLTKVLSSPSLLPFHPLQRYAQNSKTQNTTHKPKPQKTKITTTPILNNSLKNNNKNTKSCQNSTKKLSKNSSEKNKVSLYSERDRHADNPTNGFNGFENQNMVTLHNNININNNMKINVRSKESSLKSKNKNRKTEWSPCDEFTFSNVNINTRTGKNAGVSGSPRKNNATAKHMLKFGSANESASATAEQMLALSPEPDHFRNRNNSSSTNYSHYLNHFAYQIPMQNSHNPNFTAFANMHGQSKNANFSAEEGKNLSNKIQSPFKLKAHCSQTDDLDSFQFYPTPPHPPLHSNPNYAQKAHGRSSYNQPNGVQFSSTFNINQITKLNAECETIFKNQFQYNVPSLHNQIYSDYENPSNIFSQRKGASSAIPSYAAAPLDFSPPRNKRRDCADFNSNAMIDHAEEDIEQTLLNSNRFLPISGKHQVASADLDDIDLQKNIHIHNNIHNNNINIFPSRERFEDVAGLTSDSNVRDAGLNKKECENMPLRMSFGKTQNQNMGKELLKGRKLGQTHTRNKKNEIITGQHHKGSMGQYELYKHNLQSMLPNSHHNQNTSHISHVAKVVHSQSHKRLHSNQVVPSQKLHSNHPHQEITNMKNINSLYKNTANANSVSNLVDFQSFEELHKCQSVGELPEIQPFYLQKQKVTSHDIPPNDYLSNNSNLNATKKQRLESTQVNKPLLHNTSAKGLIGRQVLNKNKIHFNATKGTLPAYLNKLSYLERNAFSGQENRNQFPNVGLQKKHSHIKMHSKDNILNDLSKIRPTSEQSEGFCQDLYKTAHFCKGFNVKESYSQHQKPADTFKQVAKNTLSNQNMQRSDFEEFKQSNKLNQLNQLNELTLLKGLNKGNEINEMNVISNFNPSISPEKKSEELERREETGILSPLGTRNQTLKKNEIKISVNHGSKGKNPFINYLKKKNRANMSSAPASIDKEERRRKELLLQKQMLLAQSNNNSGITSNTPKLISNKNSSRKSTLDNGSVNEDNYDYLNKDYPEAHTLRKGSAEDSPSKHRKQNAFTTPSTHKIRDRFLNRFQKPQDTKAGSGRKESQESKESKSTTPDTQNEKKAERSKRRKGENRPILIHKMTEELLKTNNYPLVHNIRPTQLTIQPNTQNNKPNSQNRTAQNVNGNSKSKSKDGTELSIEDNLGSFAPSVCVNPMSPAASSQLSTCYNQTENIQNERADNVEEEEENENNVTFGQDNPNMKLIQAKQIESLSLLNGLNSKSSNIKISHTKNNHI